MGLADRAAWGSVAQAGGGGGVGDDGRDGRDRRAVLGLARDGRLGTAVDRSLCCAAGAARRSLALEVARAVDVDLRGPLRRTQPGAVDPAPDAGRHLHHELSLAADPTQRCRERLPLLRPFRRLGRHTYGGPVRGARTRAGRIIVRCLPVVLRIDDQERSRARAVPGFAPVVELTPPHRPGTGAPEVSTHPPAGAAAANRFLRSIAVGGAEPGLQRESTTRRCATR